MVHTLGNNNALTYSHNTYRALHLLNSKSMNWKFMDYTQYISAMIIANLMWCYEIHAFGYNLFLTPWKDHEDIDQVPN